MSPPTSSVGIAGHESTMRCRGRKIVGQNAGMRGAGGRRYGAILGVSELPTGTVALLLAHVAAIRGDGRHVCRGRRVGPWGHRLPRRRLRGAALTVACRARRLPANAAERSVPRYGKPSNRSR